MAVKANKSILKYMIKKESKSKYNNKICRSSDGYIFSSQLERDYYEYLMKLKRNGEIYFILRQTAFHLSPEVKYLVDFMIFWNNGEVTFEDTKGILTKDFILKKKLVEDRFDIQIKIIKRGDF
jgi:uncharacterized protein DUF1064